MEWGRLRRPWGAGKTRKYIDLFNTKYEEETMPDLVPAPFSNLLKRAYYEPQRQQTIYDLPLKEMYRGSANVVLSTRFHGLPARTPLGPAAGPQDQLAQNLVLAWLGGSRIIEMKTI